MEDSCVRTPHILEQINELLDDESLIKCKKVSRTMCLTIENQKSGKFLTVRMIQSYIKNPEEFEKDWRIIFKTMPREMLSEFGILVKDFYKSFPSRFEDNWSPMHIAAEHGHLDFCHLIAKLTPTKRYEWSPLLFSAQAGNLEVSKFIFREIVDKTINSHLEITAQHLAAKNGHLKIYKFLHENLNDINPIMQERITPLHLAAQNGHFNICKYICDNTALIGPYRSDTMTPLSLAIYGGHFKVARLLIQRYANIPWRVLKLIFSMFINILSALFYFLALDICLDPSISLVNKWCNEPFEFIVIFLIVPGIVSRLIFQMYANIPRRALKLIRLMFIKILNFLLYMIALDICRDHSISLVSKWCKKPVEFIIIFVIVPKILSRLIVDYVRSSRMTSPKLDY